MMHPMNQSSSVKAIVCVMKALIKNVIFANTDQIYKRAKKQHKCLKLQGCASDVETHSQRAALAEMADEFAGFDDNDEDSDESVVIQVIIIS